MANSGSTADGEEQSSQTCTATVDKLHDALLNARYAAALNICDRFIQTQRQDGTAIYLRLLLPTIRELGRDWADDRAGHNQIAFAFSLMQKLIDALGKTGVAMPRHKALSLGRVIVAVAPLDEHDSGARIAAQYLTQKGWDVIFVDGNSSTKIAALLQAESFDALALSVSTDTALLNLADMIADCRLADRSHRVRIFVGGAAIMTPYEQYDFLEADHVGIDIDALSAYLLRQAAHDRSGRGILA